MSYLMVYAAGVGSDHEVRVFKRTLDGRTDYTVQCECPGWTVPAVFATEQAAASFADGHVADNQEIDVVLDVVRTAARDGRLTRTGQWRTLRILVDEEPADMLIELAASALYMRGELYVHETPEGAYLRPVHDD